MDAFGGVSDLNAGIVRCVGCAKQRFQEDALRMMRAVRFAAQLGFSIDGETKAAVKELWLTHFSPSLVHAETYLPKVRQIFEAASLGFDGRTRELDFKEE